MLAKTLGNAPKKRVFGAFFLKRLTD